ncbi:MAG: Ig-like domain-containing protein, partial [Planctomycetota bacterium]
MTLSATDGTFDSNSLTLDSFGKAYTTWTAPPPPDIIHTITADFGAGQGYNGLDYNPSSDDVTVSVDTFTDLRETSTVVTFSKDPAYTNEDITVTATVIDQSASPATVAYGVVYFTADGGTFSRTIVLVNGTATTQWTAPEAAGVYNITASYWGYYRAGGTYNFNDSNDTNSITVQYYDSTTTTRLGISPSYPYIGKNSFVGAVVLDQSENPVPGGIVRFSAPYGSFVSNDVSVNNGV